MASNLYIYRLRGFIYPFTLQESYKKHCLYNLKTLAIKLFQHFRANPEICVFSCCRGAASPKIQREEMKFTALEAAVGDHLGTGAAILVCCWGENCCFLPPFFPFSAELCWSQQHCIRGLDHTKATGWFHENTQRPLLLLPRQTAQWAGGDPAPTAQPSRLTPPGTRPRNVCDN